MNSQIRASYWMTFPLTIINFNHFFTQQAPENNMINMFLNNLRSIPGFYFGFYFEFSGVTFYMTHFHVFQFSYTFATFPDIYECVMLMYIT
jgi:hypothetical protein